MDVTVQRRDAASIKSEPGTVLLSRVLVEFARGTRSGRGRYNSGAFSCRSVRAPWMEK